MADLMMDPIEAAVKAAVLEAFEKGYSLDTILGWVANTIRTYADMIEIEEIL
jgi:hypothetical protein